MKLPVSFLTCPSSSLSWATDQILRSDIRANDIVIWGLTTTDRFLYFKNNKITHVTCSTYVTDPLFRHRVDIEFLDSQQLMYQAVTGIHQVINFCKKINANLILAQVVGRGLETYLHDYKNYIMLAEQFGQNIEDRFLDLGRDQIHPGPLTHKWYCQQILNKYYELYKNE